jgi:hypothetical protein
VQLTGQGVCIFFPVGAIWRLLVGEMRGCSDGVRLRCLLLLLASGVVTPAAAGAFAAFATVTLAFTALFLVCCGRDTAVSFIPDSGATHILIREADAEILHSVAPFPPHTRRPQFEVANGQFIVPIASGFIGFPSTDVTLRAYLFRGHDLADNLFGIAPLLRHGYTATFTENDFALHNHIEQRPPVRHQSPTIQHLAILAAPTDGFSRGGRHPTRTACRDGSLRLRHVRIPIILDVLQRGKTRMATQLSQSNTRYGPPQQTTLASLRPRPHSSFSLWRTIHPKAPDR